MPIGRISGEVSQATLLNISRQGMAIEVPVASGFSRGDAQSFTLHDLSHSVEVRGRVRWIRSDWRDCGGPGRVQYIQVAGLTFEEILTDEPAGIWGNLETMLFETEAFEEDRAPLEEPLDVPQAVAPEEVAPEATAGETPVAMAVTSTRTITATRPEPPKLVAPINGAKIAEPAADVTCLVSLPAEVTSISINGTGATLEDGQATASVALDPGLNRLTALIWREDGSYRTYTLGQVTRKEYS